MRHDPDALVANAMVCARRKHKRFNIFSVHSQWFSILEFKKLEKQEKSVIVSGTHKNQKIIKRFGKNSRPFH